MAGMRLGGVTRLADCEVGDKFTLTPESLPDSHPYAETMLADFVLEKSAIKSVMEWPTITPGSYKLEATVRSLAEIFSKFLRRHGIFTCQDEFGRSRRVVPRFDSSCKIGRLLSLMKQVLHLIRLLFVVP